jgi:hypothetical protein
MRNSIGKDIDALPTPKLPPEDFQILEIDSEIIDTLWRMRQAEIDSLFPTLDMSNSDNRKFALRTCHDAYIIAKFLKENHARTMSEVDGYYEKILRLKDGTQTSENIELVIDIGKVFHQMLNYAILSTEEILE